MGRDDVIDGIHAGVFNPRAAGELVGVQISLSPGGDTHRTQVFIGVRDDITAARG
jgi:hypothetical protein